MKIKTKLQYVCERISVWCLNRVLIGLSAVIAAEIQRIDAESANLKSEIVIVAADHWKHLNELHKRLLKVESRVS